MDDMESEGPGIMDNSLYRPDPALLPAGLPDVLGAAAGNPAAWRARRAEILGLLAREVYGIAPPPPAETSVAVLSRDDGAFAGKATHTTYTLTLQTPTGPFFFPFHVITPHVDRPPLFLHIAFRPDLPDRYCPVEEILDRGFALASFCYQDVAPDEDDGFAGGLACAYHLAGRGPDGWGKIALWAWAASRVMDVLETLPGLDPARMAVVGHSRLGKTALWCAALDERFALAVSNESGCSGTAITRGKKGEHIHNIMERYGYWFCENYRRHAGHENDMPFDQHFLLACIAPRLLCHGGAALDEWSDPYAEFLGCLGADPVYRLLGEPGLDGPTAGFPSGPVRTAFHEGRIGYHLRDGGHFLSRTDWGQYMDFWQKHG